MKSIQKQSTTVGAIFAVDMACLALFGAVLGWIQWGQVAVAKHGLDFAGAIFTFEDEKRIWRPLCATGCARNWFPTRQRGKPLARGASDEYPVIGEKHMAGQQRKDIRPGLRVEIILKQDQRSGKRTVGVVQDVLTSAAFHSRGIKVRLADGQVGRVQAILPDKT